jgi:hypothetical protein
LKEFETALIEEKNKNTMTTTPKSNLTKLQQSCLKKIKNDRRYIVCLSDKNLGAVIMEDKRWDGGQGLKMYHT